MKTTEIKTGGGGSFTNYKIQPGTQVVYIESFELRYATHASKVPGEVTLSMRCRGPELLGFQGFAYDKDDASKGKRSHQVGFVKASNFNFADKVTKGGKEIERDVEIGRFMKEVMTALGCAEWLDGLDPEGIMTLDLWMDRVNAPNAPWLDKPLRVCIACRQYWREQDKYAQNELYVVGWERGEIRMEDGDIPEAESKVVKWDANNINHFKKAVKPATIGSFEGNTTSPETSTSHVTNVQEEENDEFF